MYLLRWTKHEYCHTNVSKEVIDNSAFRAFYMAAGRYRRMRQLVPVHRQRVTSHRDQHIVDAVHGLRRVCPNGAHGSIGAKIEDLQAMAITE